MPEKLITLFICPICNSILNKTEKRLVCENNHNFDYAKEGYIHLFPSQLKKTKSPGDNKIMVQSRKQFLEKRYFDFLVPPLISIIKQKIDKFEKPTLLDSGCGEGFFTDRIQLQINEFTFYGMDISKEAVRLAAKLNKNIQWFVASSNNIPIQPESLDIVLKINAPINYTSLQKKLSENAIVISVSPGEKHLCKLREILYLTPQSHKKEQTPENFTLLQSTNLEQMIQISNNRDIQNLFKMTPYYWNASNKTKDAVKQLKTLDTPAAFNINIYQQSNNRI